MSVPDPSSTAPPPAPPAKRPAAPDSLRWLVAGLGLAFGAMIVWASLRGDFLAEFGAVTAMPWGLVSLADLYLGFVFYVLAVLAVERGAGARALWALPVFVLGNVWAALWIVVRWRVILARLRGGQDVSASSGSSGA